MYKLFIAAFILFSAHFASASSLMYYTSPSGSTYYSSYPIANPIRVVSPIYSWTAHAYYYYCTGGIGYYFLTVVTNAQPLQIVENNELSYSAGFVSNNGQSSFYLDSSMEAEWSIPDTMLQGTSQASVYLFNPAYPSVHYVGACNFVKQLY